jgi:hypothetical protein
LYLLIRRLTVLRYICRLRGELKNTLPHKGGELAHLIENSGNSDGGKICKSLFGEK